jgi:hypothetical protein
MKNQPRHPDGRFTSDCLIERKASKQRTISGQLKPATARSPARRRSDDGQDANNAGADAHQDEGADALLLRKRPRWTKDGSSAAAPSSNERQAMIESKLCPTHVLVGMVVSAAQFEHLLVVVARFLEERGERVER